MDTKTPILFTSLSQGELTGLMEASVRKALQMETNLSGQDMLLTTRQASALICYKPSTVYELVRKGLIPHVKVRGKLLFSRKAVLDWTEAPGHTRKELLPQDTHPNKEETR